MFLIINSFAKVFQHYLVGSEKPTKYQNNNDQVSVSGVSPRWQDGRQPGKGGWFRAGRAGRCPGHGYEVSVQFSSVAQLCLTIYNPMNRSTSGLPVHHQLPEFTQTHVHQVSDAIQPSHPLSSPFPPAPIPPSISLFQ